MLTPGSLPAALRCCGPNPSPCTGEEGFLPQFKQQSSLGLALATVTEPRAEETQRRTLVKGRSRAGCPTLWRPRATLEEEELSWPPVTYTSTNENRREKQVLSTFMTLCWATFTGAPLATPAGQRAEGLQAGRPSMPTSGAQGHCHWDQLRPDSSLGPQSKLRPNPLGHPAGGDPEASPCEGGWKTVSGEVRFLR